MYKNKTKISFRKAVSGLILFCFLTGQIFTPTIVQAQVLPNLPVPGQMVWLTTGFQPPVLRGMTVHPENPLLFDFIVDRGQDKINNDLLKVESTRLIKYFLASMTIPDKDAWVNLSPYEKDRIIPDALGQTEMGRQMLEQDYMLKQLAASLTNPDTELGKKYWEQVNKSLVPGPWSLENANQALGTNHQAPSLTKVWIVPAGATVVEKDGFAYITESKLDVKMEEDYKNRSLVPGSWSLERKQQPGTRNQPPGTLQQAPDTNPQGPAAEVFRSLILPKLIKEVNEGKTFAPTRQVYQSVILAAWYKKALKDSLLGKIYADKSKVKGVESDVKDIKQKVYEQYLEAFKKGAYNFIKEEDSGADGELIPRKYFSGGITYFGETAVNVDHAASSVNAALTQVASSSLNGDFALVAALGAESAEVIVRENAIAGSKVSSSSLVEDQSRFGANNNSRIPQRSLEAMNAHPVADVQKEFEGRLEALRLRGQRVRENARIRAADWARAALRNPLALPIAYRDFMQFDVKRNRNIRVVEQFEDQAAGRFDPAKGIIALRNDADQFVEFHEAAEMVARIFKFRKYLESKGVDANNPEDLMSHARSEGLEPQNAQDALEKLMDKFFAENPDLVNQLHERAARLERRLRANAAIIIEQRSQELRDAIHIPAEVVADREKSLAALQEEKNNKKEGASITEQREIEIPITSIDSFRFNLVKVISNLFFGMPLDIPGQVALSPEEVDEPVVLASLRLFKDTEGKYRFMDPRARRVDPSLQSLIEKFGIEVRTVPDDEWNDETLETLSFSGKILKFFIGKKGHFGTDNGDAAARADVNLILLPQTMYPATQKYRDTNFAHEIGHNLDYRLGLREILSYESDEVIKAVMELGESRLHLGQASLRDSSGKLRVDEFRKILKTDDFAGREIVAEAFLKAWRSPNWDDPGTQFFRDWVPEAFEGRLTAPSTKRAELGQQVDAPTRLGADIGTAASSGINSSTAASAPAVANPGGIDFDPSRLNLQIKRDGHGVPLPLPQQNLEQININGLYPVILNIRPINAQTLPILGQLNVQPEVALSNG